MVDLAKCHCYAASFPDGSPCIIRVRTDLADKAPLAGKPILCNIALGYKGEANGLPTEREVERLQAFIEGIIEHAEAKKSGIWVGSITSHRQRIVFFYSDDADLFHKTNAAYLNSLSEIPFVLGGNAEDDPDWQLYRNTLLPSREVRAYERNAPMIEALQNYGDNLSQLRPIHHYAYFDSLADAEAFACAAGSLGKYLNDINRSIDNTEVYRVTLTHVDYIDAERMAKIAANLEALAEQYNGEYDDWEALLAK
ncbi:DUF695 domain-containing protein [Neisseria sp. 83E34]|uniref:DUF695 domain-containing protein n=1 Tax=Neisseria sp. 83E34 TaxID=1692264 RepID=UPI0006CE7AF0|nr:DUF695 domain-containing protein [Neisseria sp. 83E34]KPN70692.1 hypothetical protein AKG09_10600 [Neisseria sp. 83E34]